MSPSNSNPSIEQLLKAAEQGEASAMFRLGVCYFTGNEIDRDVEESKRWLLRAAEQQYPGAAYNVGVLFLQNSSETGGDYQQAKYWFERAGEEGDIDGFYSLAGLLLESVSQDEKRKGIQLLRSLAKDGHAKAQSYLAILIAERQIEPLDKGEFFRNLLSAAIQGEDNAKQNLEAFAKQNSAKRDEQPAEVQRLSAEELHYDDSIVPRDPALSSLLDDVLAGKAQLYSAVAPLEQVVPFSELPGRHELMSKLRDAMVRQLAVGVILPLLLYAKGDVLVMSDDYAKYYAYKSLGVTHVPCYFLGRDVVESLSDVRGPAPTEQARQVLLGS